MKKRWYDFLWIASLLYLVLGFFNILFAWLGLLCFFIPLVIAFAGGDKGDQVRVTTPERAGQLGSDYIVVGRPITGAEDPVAAWRRCRAEFMGGAK